MKTCHDMNIIVQTTGGDAYDLNGKREAPIRHLLWNQVTRNNLGALAISITYGSPV